MELICTSCILALVVLAAGDLQQYVRRSPSAHHQISRSGHQYDVNILPASHCFWRGADVPSYLSVILYSGLLSGTLFLFSSSRPLSVFVPLLRRGFVSVTVFAAPLSSGISPQCPQPSDLHSRPYPQLYPLSHAFIIYLAFGSGFSNIFLFGRCFLKPVNIFSVEKACFDSRSLHRFWKNTQDDFSFTDVPCSLKRMSLEVL